MYEIAGMDEMTAPHLKDWKETAITRERNNKQ
jgi:hypothetical protein